MWDFVTDNTPYGVEEAKFNAMKSILMTLIMSDFIKVEMKDINGENVVVGYAFVDDSLPEKKLADERNHFKREAIKEAMEKYPFFDTIVRAKYDLEPGNRPRFMETIGYVSGKGASAKIHMINKYLTDKELADPKRVISYHDMYFLYMEHRNGTYCLSELDEIKHWDYDKIRLDRTAILRKRG